MLLAYYIATVNIETAYHAPTGLYRPFERIILTCTFQMTEEGDLVDRIVLPENYERARRQLKQPIRVIVSNPPYSAQQDSENDNKKPAIRRSTDASARLMRRNQRLRIRKTFTIPTTAPSAGHQTGSGTGALSLMSRRGHFSTRIIWMACVSTWPRSSATSMSSTYAMISAHRARDRGGKEGKFSGPAPARR